MAEINIDPTDAQYQKLLGGLATLRTTLAPRVKLLLKLPVARQKLWLQHDPLLRDFVRLVKEFSRAVRVNE